MSDRPTDLDLDLSSNKLWQSVARLEVMAGLVKPFSYRNICRTSGNGLNSGPL